MYKRLAYILLIAATPLMAQDEVLEPSGNVSAVTITDANCNEVSEPAPLLNDNSTATLCDGGDGAGAESYLIRLNFATPASAPSTGTDEQVFQCFFRRSNTDSNPTAQMSLYCNDTLVEAGAVQEITANSFTEFSESVTFGGTCASDGSDAQLQLDITRTGGSPSGRRSVDVSDCDWDVTYGAASSRRVMQLD